MVGQLQREAMLKAMGYRPLRLRASPDIEASAMPQAVAAPADHRRSPSLSENQLSPSPPPPSRTSLPTDRDPLWQALLRAVHASLNQVEALGWEAVLDGPPYRYDGPRLYLNLIALRGNAPAKRALWKTLRALRRRRTGSQG